jgi:hypothetical protein
MLQRSSILLQVPDEPDLVSVSVVNPFLRGPDHSANDPKMLGRIRTCRIASGLASAKPSHLLPFRASLPGCSLHQDFASFTSIFTSLSHTTLTVGAFSHSRLLIPPFLPPTRRRQPIDIPAGPESQQSWRSHPCQPKSLRHSPAARRPRFDLPSHPQHLDWACAGNHPERLRAKHTLL